MSRISQLNNKFEAAGFIPKNEASVAEVTVNVKDIEDNSKIRQKSVTFIKDDNQIIVRFSSQQDAKNGFAELKKMGFDDADLDLGQDDEKFPFFVTVEQND